jgi:hypothetical protein
MAHALETFGPSDHARQRAAQLVVVFDNGNCDWHDSGWQ